MRATLILLALTSAALPAAAEDFAPGPGGTIEFTMPSNNIGCVYRDEDGSGLRASSVTGWSPSYLRVRLFQDGKPENLQGRR